GVRGLASELWSSAPMPMQHAAAYAWSDPAELTDRLVASRRLHGAVAHRVAEVFAEAGCEVDPPQGGFYVWPDAEPLRGALEARWSVRTGADLAGVLLDQLAGGVLPGSAFGTDAARLRMRLAVPGLSRS